MSMRNVTSGMRSNRDFEITFNEDVLKYKWGHTGQHIFGTKHSGSWASNTTIKTRGVTEISKYRNQFGIEKSKGVLVPIVWKNPLYMAFIDEEKAFDRVVRAELWKCLEERGILGDIFRAAVRTRERETDCFEVKCGLRQWCVLSPLLFVTWMDNIMKRANQEENGRPIKDLKFADD